MSKLVGSCVSKFVRQETEKSESSLCIVFVNVIFEARKMY